MDERGELVLCVPYHRVWWQRHAVFPRKHSWQAHHAMEETFHPVRHTLSREQALALDGSHALIPISWRRGRPARLGVDAFLLSDARELAETA